MTIDKNNPPIIRNVQPNNSGSGPIVRERTVVKGMRKGTEFNDISDRKSLKDFINQHDLKQISDAQDAEIQQIESGNNPQIIEQEIISPRHARQMRQPVQIDNELLSITPPKPSQSANKDPSKPDWMDEEAEDIIDKLNISNLPITDQFHIVNSNRKAKKNDKEQPKNTNVDPESQIYKNPPQLTEKQLRKQIEDQVRQELKAEPKVEPKSTPRLVVRTIPKANLEDYERVNLVSDFVFYDFSELYIRKFNIADALPLSTAKKEGNVSAFITAVGNSLYERDIRDLSYIDFRNILYWHQFNSFLKSPLNVVWKSKYDNTNYYRISDRDIAYKKPNITKEEYQLKWKSKGITIPTLRDWEFLNDNELTDDELFLYTRAQWFISDSNDPSPQNKIDKMTAICSKDLSIMEELPDFIELSSHNIEESINVADEQFNVDNWLNTLNNQNKNTK